MAIELKDIQEAAATLQRYKQGKANLEQRIIDNEEWFKQRHWKHFRRDDGGKLPSSGYLFNSILNKHADAMDHYPEPTILPREESDEATAEVLSKVIPAILERNDYQKTYSEVWWYKLKQGTGVHGVFFDPAVDDIVVRKCDLLNMFWEPGVSDIQKSQHLFHVELVDYEILEKEYPEIDFGVKSSPSIAVARYQSDESIDTSSKASVVDWYYKKYDNNGNLVLHLCKFVDDKILFASENEKGYEDGYYHHGLYPFDFDPLYPEEDMPVGFGVIDANKDGQESIDEMDSNIQWNLRATAKTRYAVKNNAGVNEKELADVDSEFVHVSSAGSVADAIAPLQVQQLDASIVNYRNQKIDELKETSGNREFNQGATAGGVTAASAIAQLQEAGNKLSRDAIISSYRAYKNVCIMVLELVRQFYTEERVFRITEPNGENRFIAFDNRSMQPQPLGSTMGVDLGVREPVFDIKVDAQKKSPFSQISHNQFIMELFNQGFFNPQIADQAKEAVSLMQFDGKDQLMKALENNAQMFAMLQQQQAQINELTGQLASLTGVPGVEEQEAQDGSYPIQAYG